MEHGATADLGNDVTRNEYQMPEHMQAWGTLQGYRAKIEPYKSHAVVYIWLPEQHPFHASSNVDIMRSILGNGLSKSKHIPFDAAMRQEVDTMFDFMVQAIFGRVFGFLVSYADGMGKVGTDTAYRHAREEVKQRKERGESDALVVGLHKLQMLAALVQDPSSLTLEQSQACLERKIEVVRAWKLVTEEGEPIELHIGTFLDKDIFT